MVNSPEDSGNERTSQGYKPATRKHVGWVDKTLSFFLSFTSLVRAQYLQILPYLLNECSPPAPAASVAVGYL